MPGFFDQSAKQQQPFFPEFQGASNFLQKTRPFGEQFGLKPTTGNFDLSNLMANQEAQGTGISLGNTSFQGVDMGNLGNLNYQPQGSSFMEGMLGSKNKAGWAGTALGLASAGMQTYLGLKNLGVMKDSLKFQKDSFTKQFDIQKSEVNRRLEDRQKMRVEAAGGPNENISSVDDYMNKNRV